MQLRSQKYYSIAYYIQGNNVSRLFPLDCHPIIEWLVILAKWVVGPRVALVFRRRDSSFEICPVIIINNNKNVSDLMDEALFHHINIDTDHLKKTEGWS